MDKDFWMAVLSCENQIMEVLKTPFLHLTCYIKNKIYCRNKLRMYTFLDTVVYKEETQIKHIYIYIYIPQTYRYIRVPVLLILQPKSYKKIHSI